MFPDCVRAAYLNFLTSARHCWENCVSTTLFSYKISAASPTSGCNFLTAVKADTTPPTVCTELPFGAFTGFSSHRSDVVSLTWASYSPTWAATKASARFSREHCRDKDRSFSGKRFCCAVALLLARWWFLRSVAWQLRFSLGLLAYKVRPIHSFPCHLRYSQASRRGCDCCARCLAFAIGLTAVAYQAWHSKERVFMSWSAILAATRLL